MWTFLPTRVHFLSRGVISAAPQYALLRTGLINTTVSFIDKGKHVRIPISPYVTLTCKARNAKNSNLDLSRDDFIYRHDSGCFIMSHFAINAMSI